MERRCISLVLSVYNEEEGILHFYNSLRDELKLLNTFDFELVWVNDGSADNSQKLIDSIKLNEAVENIKHTAIQFSKNFGHEAAMIAGIDNSKGEAIICMDSDGQHPPKKIPEILQAYSQGVDIVLMERTRREDGSKLKKFFSGLFYGLLNKLSAFEFNKNSTDFFMITRQVSEVLGSAFRERSRYIRGFIQSIGFEKRIIEFEAPNRMHGESSYSFFKLFKLAFNAIFAFSNKPLRLGIITSVGFTIFTILFGSYTLGMYIFSEQVPSGYTSIVLFMAIAFTTLSVTITILSLYFEKALEEIRQRPIYIIKKLNK